MGMWGSCKRQEIWMPKTFAYFTIFNEGEKENNSVYNHFFLYASIKLLKLYKEKKL